MATLNHPLHARICSAQLIKFKSVRNRQCQSVDINRLLEKIQMKELLKDFRRKFDLVTEKTIVKLHEQFGHPSREALASAFQNMNAGPDWIACARLYTCEYCLTRQRCKLVRVAALPRAISFKQVLDIDVFQVL